MKKLYMCTIICSSRWGCVLIISFQLYGSILAGSQYHSLPLQPSTSILDEELKYNSMQFLSSLSKIISSISKVQKIDENS